MDHVRVTMMAGLVLSITLGRRKPSSGSQYKKNSKQCTFLLLVRLAQSPLSVCLLPLGCRCPAIYNHSDFLLLSSRRKAKSHDSPLVTRHEWNVFHKPTMNHDPRFSGPRISAFFLSACWILLFFPSFFLTFSPGWFITPVRNSC